MPRDCKRNSIRAAVRIAVASLVMGGAAGLLRAAEPGTQTAPFPGRQSAWNGFDRYDFTLDGRACIVVLPKTAAEGKPWIWRARFFGHEPQTDLALLGKGFHLVYMDVAGLYGCPKAVAHWDAFYKYLTGEHGFAPKAALEGMSRGGLIVFNWAAVNPDKTACIYADAPVCDFKSWPGGKGRGRGSRGDWANCLKVYGLSEEQALAYKHNPIDNLGPLAKAGVPLLHVCGDADDVVPIEENTGIVEKRYRALGGHIRVIVKPGVGHHPHSLKDPAPIVEFIAEHEK
jgi:pimeloyl-ACP methyl ester carboxylesterase